MIEILSRVEVSNPLQFRCVCKLWKSLVVDPQFVKNHLHRSFTDITDLASKAMDDMNAFESQLNYNYAPVPPPQQPPQNDEEEEEEEDEEEEEERNSFSNEVAQLDNLLLVVRSLKGSLETIKVDVQAIKERMKCLQSFLLIYLKTAKASSSSVSASASSSHFL